MHFLKQCWRGTKVEIEIIVCFSIRSSEISPRNPLRIRETPLWALPCVSNEFTWRPTVYLRHFFLVYVRVRRMCVCVRIRVRMYMCVCTRVGQHVGRDSLQRQMLNHLPVVPSRYETQYDYTLSAHCESRAVPSCRPSSFDSIQSSLDDATQRLLGSNNVSRHNSIRCRYLIIIHDVVE